MTGTVTPADWAKRPLQKYADFGGRAPRAEYWWYTLAVIVAAIVVNMVEAALGMSAVAATYGPLSLMLLLGLLVPGLAVTARRLHDTNRSGWWMLIALGPYAVTIALTVMAVGSGSMMALGSAGLVGILALVGALVLLVFMVLPGNPGDNRFGPSPYGEAGSPVPAA